MTILYKYLMSLHSTSYFIVRALITSYRYVSV